MVYHGPARGCQRCKDRRVKCGLERPICKQCAKLKFSCPGYGHELDVILRNQTASVVSRNQWGNARRRWSRSSDRRIGNAVPNGLSESVEIRALTFLFTSSAIMSNKDRRSSHGHLDFLQGLYDKTTSDSALSITTTWFALLILGLCDKSSTCYGNKRDQLMNRAIRSISEAIKDLRMSVTNETLTAVILLAYGEHLQYKKTVQGTSQSYPKTRLLVHQDGAEALIQKRKTRNFSDSISIALYNAVRHNAVGMAFAGIREVGKMWTVDSDDEARQLCDSYTFATELDACCLSMLSLKKKMMCEDVSKYAELQADLLSLLERLRYWQRRLSNEWFFDMPGHHSETKPLDICYLFNDWYLLQLAVSHLLKELRSRTMGPGLYASEFSHELDLIDNIIASESLFIRAEHIATSALEEIDEENQGRRLFYHTIAKFDSIVSDALQRLALPHTVALCYREVLSWTRKER